MQKTLLFLGKGNASLTQMAEGYVRNIAQEPLMVLSAGSKPKEKLDPKTIEVMREVNIDISDQTPKAFKPEMMLDVDKAIVMGSYAKDSFEIPMQWNDFENWNLESPVGKDEEFYRKMRDQINQKVRDLLDDMGAVVMKLV